jgi:hypothetical protein
MQQCREETMKKHSDNEDVLDEYDFSNGVRGKYADSNTLPSLEQNIAPKPSTDKSTFTVQSSSRNRDR